MQLNILSVENGYILSWREDEENDIGEVVKEVKREVIEEKDDMNDNETMVRMLEKVAEHFGVMYDKYGEHNLEISFTKKGHKLE